MNNVFGYLKEYGGFTFSQKKFCDVDGLILAQFSYLKVDGMVPRLREGAEAVTLRSLSEHPDKEKLFADERYAKNNRRLFAMMCASVRFRDIRINDYVSITDEQIGTQFAAMVITIGEKLHYVAFRGTDETIVGWKEDFCMAFTGTIPSQDYSVIYLTRVADKMEGRFYIGGHSKGGNLAVYAALRCPADIEPRIGRIYSFDAPGFRSGILEGESYRKICGRIRRWVPQSCVVGMMLQYRGRYHVVQSTASGLLQHDPFSWLIEEGRFVQLKALDKKRRKLDSAINTWIMNMSDGQIRRFVGNLFDILYASETDNLIELFKHRKQSVSHMLAAYKKMEPAEKRFMRRMLGKLLVIQSGYLLREK